MKRPSTAAPIRLGVALSLLVSPAAAQDTVRRPDVHFVPTPQHVVDAMLRLAGVGRNDVLFDLGSGDGRIVITAAKRYGARGVGVDLDSTLVQRARAGARAAGVAGRVRFLRQDLFTIDISAATVVTLYLLPVLNLRLRPTLFSVLRPGTRIASHAFDMGDWQPDARLEIEGSNVFFWTIPADVRGDWAWQQRGAEGVERHSITFQQRYQKVSGSWESGGDGVAVPAVRLVGDSIVFRVSRAGGELVVHAKVTGDAMAGTIERDGGAPEPWSARRLRQAAGSITDEAELP